MNNIFLTNEEFKKLTGYEYEKINIKLEVSKDSETLKKIIIIKNLKELEEIFEKVKELSFEEGFEDCDYRNLMRNE